MSLKETAWDAIEKAKTEGKTRLVMHPVYRYGVSLEDREAIAKYAQILGVELHIDNSLEEGEYVIE